MLSAPAETWLLITHLGAASIMLPMFVMLTAELSLAGQRSGLVIWLLAMITAVALVLASKIAFIGWGLGSASLNFTGISGHTMLASSILPVWLGLLLAGPDRRFSYSGIALGLALGALVGGSRVVLGAHSPSEVVAGWLLGTATSLVACKVMTARMLARRWAGLAGLLLLLAFSPSFSGYLPTRAWEIDIALALSGHPQPFIRQDLHRPPPMQAHQSLPLE